MSELKERLTRILVDEVGPALQLDGSGIEVIDIENGVARVRLSAVCGSCPNTLMTVIHGLEQELRTRLPEIEYLEAVP